MPGKPTIITDAKLDLYFTVCDTDKLQLVSNPARRAEILHFEYGFTRGELMILGEATKKIWEHMTTAHAYGREVGRRGRPPLLTKPQEQMLLKESLKNAQANSPLTARRLREMV